MESRTQRRAAATRLAILQGAEALLMEGGPNAVTPEAVATRADVAMQTVYNRVGGRSALLIAVAERALDENRQYMDAAYAADGDVEEKLRCVAAAYASFAKERPHQFRILVEPPDEPEALIRIAALIRQQNAKLAALIDRGIKEGWAHAAVVPDQAATALWAMMNGVISLMWRADSLRLDIDHIDELLGTAISLLIDGIKRRNVRLANPS
ncbi:TetR/AcrR family transcriptional regulator [Burkholderia sp. Nafp2/4-1b]|uniref:TetR/AcrR family transcriptional regulator n=1 Tax=Burkholderia sp. Nafp2/4-1b TaxID=2116686 RepID=UPI000EF8907F|nr:WHG domain-containing protein [Burkholderia sp. Nafp2/4-1b]RKU04292.1 TetR/AcrR family transcriptional regulator [Burkholderia sp. Nafp2/4-1b]